MYCPNCGEENVDEPRYCVECGKLMRCVTPTAGKFEPHGYGSPESEYSPPEVDNHLVWAILATIFCCLPFGIVSIVYAAQVNSLLASGNIDGARQASDKAKMWAWISFGIGIFLSWPGVGVYAILGPIGIILLAIPALVALAIWLLVRNSSKGR